MRIQIDTALYALDCAIKDLARQEETEYRARYYGECKGKLACLVILGVVNYAERHEWKVKILEAHLQAIAQCEAAGEVVAEGIKLREAFWLKHHQEKVRDLAVVLSCFEQHGKEGEA